MANCEDNTFVSVNRSMLESHDSIEVVSNCLSDSDFISMESVSSESGDPHEKRQDIIETKDVIEKLKEKLTFKDETVLNELTVKLKARDTLDSGIGGEIRNLESIAENQDITNEEMREAARLAMDHISKARQTAKDGKTTVKRAMEILEHTLPIFVTACDVSNDKFELSDSFNEALQAHHKSRRDMMDCQKQFDMEGRANNLQASKDYLEQSIEAAMEDSRKIKEKIKNDVDKKRLEQFRQTKDEVDLVISTENQELDGWLTACRYDIGQIKNIILEQNNRYDDATQKFESRTKKLELKIDVNNGRQADLRRQLTELDVEKRRLSDNKEFERQVQERAEELHKKVSNELLTKKEDIKGIESRAQTAQRVMESMYECSKILFGKSIEIEIQHQEKLKQFELEAMTRERNALSTAVVEGKVQTQMADDNISEYKEQIRDLRKQSERAAARGQAVIVQKRKQDLEDFQIELQKETTAKKESLGKVQELEEKLKHVDEDLENRGVAIQHVDELYEQRKAEQMMSLEEAGMYSLTG